MISHSRRIIHCPCNFLTAPMFPNNVWAPGIHDSRCLIHYLRYRVMLKQSSERRSGPLEVIGMDVWIQKQLPPELLPSPQLEAWLLLRGKLFMSFDVNAFSRFRFNNKKARAVCALLDDAFVHLKPHLEMSEHPNKRKRILLIRKHLRLCLSKLHPAYKKIKRKLVKAGSIASILRLCKPRPKCSFCGVVLTQDCLFMLLDSCPHLTCYGCEPLQDPRKCNICSKKFYGVVFSDFAGIYLKERRRRRWRLSAMLNISITGFTL